MTLTVTGTIGLPELGGGTLPLDSAGTVKVVSYDPGAVVKVRGVAKSPSMHGGVQTYSKKDLRVLALTLRFYAASKGALDTLVETYLDAFDQQSYPLSVLLNGVTATWQCNDAEYRPVTVDGADGADKFSLAASPLRQAFAFTIPTQPIPTTGVF